LILISTRIKKIKEIKIINTDTLASSFKFNLFEVGHELTLDDEVELLHFFRASGLKEIFENKYISDLNDYVFGVEVGLDSHARKNRSGDLMDLVVYNILNDFVQKNDNFAFIKQANSTKIKSVLGYDVKKHISDRIFDFALLNRKEKKLYLIEVNLYGSGGTKLKSVAGEFEKVNNFILGQDIDFIWVSDGVGWKTAENPMKEAFENNRYTFNLKQFKVFLLKISNGK
jgi:type II restriction enzyme